mgnify:CR=1 FL=1
MKDDKIYEMLNDAEIDLNEYEVEELSSEEKERYKTRIRMEVKRMNMETRNKKNKNIRKIAAGMAAACAVAVGLAQHREIKMKRNFRISILPLEKSPRNWFRMISVCWKQTGVE